MTEEQTEAVMEALIGINQHLKLIAHALVDIYAKVGVLEDQEIWTPSAREYGNDE